MAAQNKITISFGKEFDDVYRFLKDKPNVSRFICEAVRDKMTGDDLEVKIEKILVRILDGRAITKRDDRDLEVAASNFEF